MKRISKGVPNGGQFAVHDRGEATVLLGAARPLRPSPGRRVTVGENDLATTHPHLAAEWDSSGNPILSPRDVSAGSHKVVGWRCEFGHQWSSTVKERTRPRPNGCPYCSGARPILGETDLATVNPELAAEWDHLANDGLSPEETTAGSNRKVGWLCSAGHTWRATVSKRSQGTGCPYCAHRIPISGETDLATVNPELAAEWDHRANDGWLPEDFTSGARRKVAWRCAAGHTWRAPISGRSKGRGCPFCSGRSPIVGETDLQTVHPELAAEWDRAANGELLPQHFSGGSDRKVGWRCGAGHTWRTRISHRVKGLGCPYCGSRATMPGENDLGTLHPNLAAEWDHSANGGLLPEHFTPGSGQNVGWRCDAGHTWRASINNRSRGRGCPKCSTAGSSKIERALASSCAELLDGIEAGSRIDLAWSKKQTRASVDVVGTYRGRKVAIEYDGEYFHSTPKKAELDESKTHALLGAGYLVVRVRENNLDHLPIEHPNLLQLEYQYKSGTEDALLDSVGPTKVAIESWLRERTA